MKLNKLGRFRKNNFETYSSCLMSCAWKNPKCRIGLIIGTGTNACYLEDIEKVNVCFVTDKSHLLCCELWLAGRTCNWMNTGSNPWHELLLLTFRKSKRSNECLCRIFFRIWISHGLNENKKNIFIDELSPRPTLNYPYQNLS